MKSRCLTNASLLLCLAVFAAIAYGVNLPASPDPALPAFEFHREGAASPEDAATAMFRGIAMESPKYFVQHLLLGVCDGLSTRLRMRCTWPLTLEKPNNKAMFAEHPNGRCLT
jgi:hypothetical protein